MLVPQLLRTHLELLLMLLLLPTRLVFCIPRPDVEEAVLQLLLHQQQLQQQACHGSACHLQPLPCVSAADCSEVLYVGLFRGSIPSFLLLLLVPLWPVFLLLLSLLRRCCTLRQR